MVNLVLLITTFLLGLVFQSLLHGASRMLIDAFLGFLGGLISGMTGNYIPLSFVLGCLGRMLIGGYIICVVLMMVYIGFGFFVGYYIF